jgi:hypothetical protein
MKTLIRLLVLAVLVAVMGGATCRQTPPPVVIEAGDTTSCPAACETLQRLGCPEGEPLEDGTSCVQFCEKTQQEGHPLKPACVKDITSCDQLNACMVPGR